MTVVDIEAPRQVPRDRWGRPLILPLEAFDGDGFAVFDKRGKLPKRKGMQRVTTLSKAAESTDALTNWACRMTLVGAASRPDIIASVQATDPGDRQSLDALVEKAKELGGANVRRELGTAVHKFFELKAADPTYTVPAAYEADVDAILAAIDRAGFDIVTEHSEQLVVIYAIGCAGTPDLILRHRATGLYHIGDLKTGASVQYGALGWATQLSAYSMADGFYVHGDEDDGSEDRLLPMPEIEKDRAYIIHCEPQSGRADVHALTIGSEFVDLAVAVREIRKRRDLLTKFEGGGTDAPAGVDPVAHAAEVVGSVEDNQPPAAAPVTSEVEASGVAPSGQADGVGESTPSAASLAAILHETRTAWLVNKATHLVKTLSKEHVAQVWPVDVARPLAIKDGQATWTDADIDLIAKALDALEAKHDVPFGHEDPAVTAARREQLEAKVAAEVERTTVTPAPEPPVDGAPYAPADAVKNLTAIVKAMAARGTPDEQARIRRVQHWQTQGSNKNVPWKIGELPLDEVPLRLFAIVAAAVGCLDLIEPDAADPDSRVRDLLGVVLEDHDLAQQPSHPVGALFGLLTTDQAHRLADMAETATQATKEQHQ